MTEQTLPSPIADRNGAIRRVNPLEEAGWDSWLTTCPSASFFQGTAWARVLNETYGFTPIYFVQGTQSHMTSLLPVMEVKSHLTGNRGISLPFTDECPPSAPDAQSFQELFREAVDFGRSRGWRHLECRGAGPLMGTTPVSTSYYGHQLDLRNKGEAALFAGLSGPARRAVRKAEKFGLSVEYSESLRSVEEFYGLLCKTRRRHGLPPQPFNFFANIQRHILSQRGGVVVTARLGTVPVASAIFFHFGRTALFKFAASDERFHHMRINNHVMWQAINRYARLGFESIDFGRTSVFNAGLRRFKLGWGAQERPIGYLRYNCSTETFVAARDESAGWYNGLFKMLPLALSRLAGATLYKHAA